MSHQSTAFRDWCDPGQLEIWREKTRGRAFFRSPLTGRAERLSDLPGWKASSPLTWIPPQDLFETNEYLSCLKVLVGGVGIPGTQSGNHRRVTGQRMETKGLANYIPQLTGIRAIAAYMVFAHNIPLPPGLLSPLPAAMIDELHIGVTMFFVLSGFVIYWNYADTVQLKKSWIEGYLTNRFARLYPVYFLLTAATLIVRDQFDGFDWFINLTFIRGFSNPLKYAAVAQGWSLTPEWCFYLAVPFLFILIKRYGFLIPLLGVYALGGVLLFFGESISLAVNYYHFFRGFTFMAESTFFGRAFEFFAGMYLARHLMERKNGEPIRPWPVCTWSALGLIAASVYGLSTFQSPAYHYGVEHPVGRALNNFVLPVFFCLLFFGLITEQSLFRKFLSSKLMVLLGKSSYSFYLIHIGIFLNLLAFILPIHTLMAPFPNLWMYGAGFLLMNLFALAIYFLVERPMNIFLRRTLTPKSGPESPLESQVTQESAVLRAVSAKPMPLGTK